MNTRARKLRKDFLPCGDQRSIEENLNRLQDMYGYEEENVKIINEQSVHLTGSSVWGEADVVPDVYEDIKAGETYIFSFQLYNFNHGPLEIVAENNGELFVEGINDIFEITSDGEKYHLKTASGPMDIVATLERVGSTHPINHKYLPEGYPYEETVTNRTAIVEETVLTGGSNGGGRVYFPKVPVSKMIETGKMYEVTIDGTKHTLKCGWTEVGEGSKIPYMYNEFFEIGKYDSTNVSVTIKTTDPALTSVSFSLYEVEEQTIVHPLAEKFLPEGIGGAPVFDYDEINAYSRTEKLEFIKKYCKIPHAMIVMQDPLGVFKICYLDQMSARYTEYGDCGDLISEAQLVLFYQSPGDIATKSISILSPTEEEIAEIRVALGLSD